MTKYSEKVRERVTETIREDICRTALDVIREQGWEAFTTDNIAKRLEMSRTLLYRYFRSKEDILLNVLTMILSENNQKVSVIASEKGSASERILKISETLVDESIKNMWFHRMLIEHTKPPKLLDKHPFSIARNKQFEIYEKLIQEGIRSGEFRADLDVLSAVRLFFGGLHELCFINGQLQERISPAPVIKIFLQGILAK